MYTKRFVKFNRKKLAKFIYPKISRIMIEPCIKVYLELEPKENQAYSRLPLLSESISSKWPGRKDWNQK